MAHVVATSSSHQLGQRQLSLVMVGSISQSRVLSKIQIMVA
jgi:hypothetical protein